MKTAEEFYSEIFEEIKELHKKKGADYGIKSDPFANLRGVANLGISPWIGVFIRILDKIFRIQSFIKNQKLENESIEDSFIDLANYAMLALALYREENQNVLDKETPPTLSR